ncbi:MAG: L-threonylcarbamoyladenylate synthase [Pseudomonadota bacterium]
MAHTERLTDGPKDIDRAAVLLSKGKLVAFPTETVYGLGANAHDSRAVAEIFAAKGRPEFNPLIVHVESTDEVSRYAVLPNRLKRLASDFWPGPLTLVLPSRPRMISYLVTSGLDTVAIRVPGHPLAQALLKRFAGPVAAPSANPSGRISPTAAKHVIAGLDGRIAAVLDGGACPLGIESTILGFENDRATLLRPGAVTIEELEGSLGQKLTVRKHSTISSPGQLASHYAPESELRLNAQGPEPGERWLGFDRDEFGGMTLSRTGDLVEAAANLFSALYDLDAQAKGSRIAVAPIPEIGLGIAINDRLRRAATRDQA